MAVASAAEAFSILSLGEDVITVQSLCRVFELSGLHGCHHARRIINEMDGENNEISQVRLVYLR